jgi:hypothetical protein
VKDNLKKAMESSESCTVQLDNGQELVVNGARLDYFLVWDSSKGAAPSIGTPSSIPKVVH